MGEISNSELLQKYSYPAPRYTSYPPVPLWDETAFTLKDWQEAFEVQWKSGSKNAKAQLYIHLPYCESLCTFCACNKRITKNHNLEEPYIDAVLKEIEMYVQIRQGLIPISEIHLGGGTPTFFSSESLKRLIEGVMKFCYFSAKPEMGIEIHPGVTSVQQIRDLAAIGFNRISIGIQDFTPFILEKINRYQSYAQTLELVVEARKFGFTSINFDLVYGLPFQKTEHVIHTIEKVIALDPDRIAYYGYAHVPWKSKGQRHYTENDLPNPLSRWNLFETGKSLLLNSGYKIIGLDHFAKESDPLFTAVLHGNLHRNFMGYTEQSSEILIGLGASAIGETPDAYGQNSPVVEDYIRAIASNQLPTIKGHRLSDEDKYWKSKIMDLMCNGQTSYQNAEIWTETFERLEEMRSEGLVNWDEKELYITSLGFPFMRNICQMLDHRFWNKQENKPIYSSAV
jgi:oxygen-independent coproporphyrinogen-3 oxidase